MDVATAKRLAELNRHFYDGESADAFNATRTRPWRGWNRIVPLLPERGAVATLDLGCGNGRLYGYLAERLGERLRYLGVDESEHLLALARRRFPAASFLYGNLLRGLPQAATARPHGLVCLFGVLHHVPGRSRRADLLRKAVEALAPGGLLAASFWRFDRDPRFARRRLTAAEIAAQGIPTERLERGDALLRFGTQSAPRYCHFADGDEIDELLACAGATEVARFLDDGEHKNLNEYAVLKR